MNTGSIRNLKILSGLLDTTKEENGIITPLVINSITGDGEMQFSYIKNEVLNKL